MLHAISGSYIPAPQNDQGGITKRGDGTTWLVAADGAGVIEPGLPAISAHAHPAGGKDAYKSRRHLRQEIVERMFAWLGHCRCLQCPQ